MKIRTRIAAALRASDDPDPRDVATAIVMAMSSEERSEALIDVMAEQVRIEVTRMRARGRKAGPSRWAARATRHFVPEVGWKFEVDLTVEDLELMVADYAQQADRLNRRADWGREWIDKLLNTGATSIGEYEALVTT